MSSWAASALTPQEELWQLASQLHVTADVAWKKHSRLQGAVISLAIAIFAFALAEVL